MKCKHPKMTKPSAEKIAARSKMVARKCEACGSWKVVDKE